MTAPHLLVAPFAQLTLLDIGLRPAPISPVRFTIMDADPARRMVLT